MNFCEHGNFDLPSKVERSIGRVFITPARHRRHHGRERGLLDTNFGTIFFFWDRLFGTHGENGSEISVDTGLPGIEGRPGILATLALPARIVFRGSQHSRIFLGRQTVNGSQRIQMVLCGGADPRWSAPLGFRSHIGGVGMRFWQALSYERTEDLVPLAQTCEELGFEGVFLADHVVGHRQTNSRYPYSYNEGEADFVAEVEFPEPFSAICAMAAVTRTLRFNTQIYVAPLRHPILLAKALATASVISGGRTILGAGVGWLREEFEVLGEDFPTRGRRLDEMIEIMRKLWSGEMVEHRGEFFEFEALRMLPAPVAPVPIMCGGLHPRVLERAGRLCDGWISPGIATSDFERIRDTIESARTGAGRSDSSFRYVVAAPNEGELDWYRALDDSRVTIVNHPLTFSLGPDASLDQRRDALASYAGGVGIGASA
ncbi:MAG: TIGR03619 family F420-dependent LLM class oxidoreductase [bacterium]|nr:TIGR03619 family F420-dependent LLM class oxidoreductase [bacterium]